MTTTIDNVNFQIQSLSNRLTDNYLTKNQINTLISAKLSKLESVEAEVRFLNQQYNVVVGSDAKLMTTAEYNTFVGLQTTVRQNIEMINRTVQGISTQSLTFQTDLHNLTISTNAKVVDLTNKYNTLNDAITQIIGQLATLRAAITRLGGL